jgi:hypothetical protein
MKYSFAFVFVTLLVAGCSHVPVNLNLYDCGDDLTCFQEKSKFCEPAKVLLTQDGGDENNRFSITVRSEIQGGNTSACQYYVVVQDAKIIYSNLSDTDRLAADILISGFKGRDMRCTIPAKEIYPDTPVTNYVDRCEGSLLELFREIY